MIYKAHYPKEIFGPGAEHADFSSLREGSIGKPVYATVGEERVQIGEITEVEETDLDVVVTMSLIDNDLTRAAADSAGWLRYVAIEQQELVR